MKHILIIVAFVVMLAGCRQYDDVENDDCVELSFRINTLSLGTRGNVTDNPTNPSTWTQKECAVDGRYLYNLSVYIINEENEIVASKENLKIENQATEHIVTFDKSYGLKRGYYKLLAVANHADHTINEKTYKSGLIRDWSSSDYDALMNNMIEGIGADNVSSKEVIQPLSLVKQIELHAGNNDISGELVRTFARIRIEVKNNSGHLPLKISNLTFSENFTQKQAYVFDDGSDRKYFGETGAPLSSSSYALQPFLKDNDSDYKTIAPTTSSVVFDSYLLESQVKDGEFYTYTLDLKYEGAISSNVEFVPDWGQVISKIQNLGVEDESYFLMYSTYVQRFISNGDGMATTATLSSSSTTVGTANVWQLVRTSKANQYYIKNVETGLYLQAPETNYISLGTSPQVFTFENKSLYGGSSYIIMKGQNNRYISVTSKSGYRVQGSKNVSSETYFRFYPVTKTGASSGGESISYNVPIKLTTINPITQQPSLTTAIKRNDFINVLVTVSYNPESAEFEFFVEDWNVGGGSVEFD